MRDVIFAFLVVVIIIIVIAAIIVFKKVKDDRERYINLFQHVLGVIAILVIGILICFQFSIFLGILFVFVFEVLIVYNYLSKSF